MQAASLCLRIIRSATVGSVTPETRFSDLDRRFIHSGVSSFPVVDDGKLVGIVCRFDIVRQISVEQSLSELASEYYDPACRESGEARSAVADRVGRRLSTLKVGDLMIQELVTVAPETSIEELANRMVERKIHHVLVTDGDELLGIVSTLDLAKVVAGRN